MDAGGASWRSIHIFLVDPRRMERFLLEEVQSEITRELDAGGLADWFFIRYWNGGPHLRVRLQGCDEAALARVCATWRARIDGYRSGALAHAPFGSGRAPRPSEESSARAYEDGTIVEIPYVPEVQRYGGPRGIQTAESLFCESTRLALPVVAATAWNDTRRWLQALDFMLVAAAVACDRAEEVGGFFDAYAEFWRAHAALSSPEPASTSGEMAPDRFPPQITHSVQNRLNGLFTRRTDIADASERGLGAQWLHALLSAGRVYRRLAADGALVSNRTGTPVNDEEGTRATLSDVIVSQMHMLNNRLGVLPTAEHALARRLAAALMTPTIPDGAVGT